ncbi:hypothetical protein LIER_43322 [Lithospermum erythrorhizon]|uniref:Uncharacterized protein n=1 Tax=Lithospermum erythrorhizon TaxID=34254 RepID=A0AAV3PZ80_LITER
MTLHSSKKLYPPMTRTKRTAFHKPSPPSPQEGIVCWGHKDWFSRLLSTNKAVVALLAPKASPNKAAHDALILLLDERVLRRVVGLGPGP